jgi:sulfur transfer complex TusBCD TusB component (DsrH family)
MIQSIVISNFETSSLKLALQIVKKVLCSEIYLLSDAVFMLNDIELIKVFRDIKEFGTPILIIKDDFEKRKSIHMDLAQIISYDDFVQRLLSRDVKIINL